MDINCSNSSLKILNTAIKTPKYTILVLTWVFMADDDGNRQTVMTERW